MAVVLDDNPRQEARGIFFRVVGVVKQTSVIDCLYGDETPIDDNQISDIVYYSRIPSDKGHFKTGQERQAEKEQNRVDSSE